MAEIQELKKALVLHYTFDDMVSSKNIVQKHEEWTSYSDGSGTSFVGTKIVDENGVVFIQSINQNTRLRWSNWLPVQAEEKYTISIKYKQVVGDQTFRWQIQERNTAGGGTVLTTHWTQNSTKEIWLDDEWKIIYYHLTIQNNGYLMVWLQEGADYTTYTQSYYLKDFYVETGHTYTPGAGGFTLSTYNETGLTQHSIVQNKNISIDSAIGQYSLYCNNTKILTPITGNISQGATLSLWINLPKDNSGNNIFPSSSEVVVADKNSQLAFGFYNNMHGIITCNGFAKPIMTNLKTELVNGWNHIAVIRDNNSNVKGYLNGVEYPLTGSQEWTHSEPYFSIGCRYSGNWTSYYNGQVDDIRFYNTYLSPEEIKDLYNCGGRISNLGDALTGSFIEGATATKINKNHTMEVNEIHEIDLGSEYEQLEYIESTGTQYIDTGYYWQNEKAKIVADLMITNNSSNQTIFGNEERYSGSNRYFAHILHGNNGNFSNYLGIGSVGAQTKLPLNNRYTIEYTSHGDHTFSTKTISPTGAEIVYNNKTTYSGTILTHQNSTQTSIANRGHIFIFANHNAYNGVGPIQQIGGMKLYRFTMIDNDKYVRDFIPCRRKNDSKIGLFDLITNQFYTTPVGEFSAGAVTYNNITAKILIDGRLYSRQIIEI